MEIKIKEILWYGPCPEGLSRLYAWAGSDPETTVSLREILGNSGPEDAFWALRCWPVDIYRPLLADVAELVLPAWHRMYPDDDRPRRAIAAARTGDAGVMASACDDARNAAWEAAWGDEAAHEAADAAWEAASPHPPSWDADAWAEAVGDAAVDAGASWDQLGVLMTLWLETVENEEV